MRERPILMSAPMVRAILAGTKTQTRRVVKGWQLEWLQPPISFTPEYVALPENGACPYGNPGDLLWVRESYRFCAEADTIKPRDTDASYRVWYEADAPHQAGFGKLCPGMFMPRWASRITLEVTGVRVERLQDISEADAVAEGIERRGPGWRWYSDAKAYTMDPRTSYRDLWESINGPDSWAANPWVWVVEFKRVTP